MRPDSWKGDRKEVSVALPSIIPRSHRMRVEEKAVYDKLQNLALRIGQEKIFKLDFMH
jgi:hypothetical protein